MTATVELVGIILAALLSAIVVWAMWMGASHPQPCPAWVQQPAGVEWVCQVTT